MVGKSWISKTLNVIFISFCFLVCLFFLKLFVITSFKIPSDSMEPLFFSGDYILVDKCSKGARLFNVSDAINRKHIKIHRVPGWRNFERNDILVFNFPYPGRWDSIVFDVMKYYVKRCIALPGDTLEIRKAHYKIRGVNQKLGNLPAQDALQRLIETEKINDAGLVLKSYPNNEHFDWTIAEFGPLYIPAQGSIIKMTPHNKLLYSNVIEWEQKKKLYLRGDTVLLGDSIIHKYCFLDNYYFVSGDKMINSQDSRYWGILPESFIVGRATMIWKSIDYSTDKIRWNRFLKRVKSE